MEGVRIDETVQVTAVAVLEVEFRVAGEHAGVEQVSDASVVWDHVAQDADLKRVATRYYRPANDFEDHEFLVALAPDEAAGSLTAFADVLDGFVGITLIKTGLAPASGHACGWSELG